MIPAVAQAIQFCQGLFLNVPMSRGRLTSSNIYTTTNGSKMPFANCEYRMSFKSGKPGIKTTAAPPKTKNVYSQ